MRLRHAPDLHFQPDPALDDASQIDRLLRRPEVSRDLAAPAREHEARDDEEQDDGERDGSGV